MENSKNSFCGCPEPKSSSSATKYYREIGAEVIGNQLLIRVEKDKSKVRKKSGDWDPPCHCRMIPEIKRPTRTQPLRIVNIDDDNQIIFRIGSTFQITSEDPKYQPEIMTYQLGDISHGDEERTLMIHPQLEGSGPQEVYRDHVTIGNQNIFMMKIKKKPNAKDVKNRNIELEVTYPNLPPRISTPPPTPPRTPSPSPPPIAITGNDNPAPPARIEKIGKNKKKKQSKKKKKKRTSRIQQKELP